jgi:protease I
MSSSLQGLKVAIVATDGFEQVELVEPKKALEDAGTKVEIVSPAKQTIQGWNHDEKADKFPIDKNIDQVKADDYDALLLPGGVINPDALRLSPATIQFIKDIATANKPIAAICHGPWTLINAEAVKNHRMTSWPSIKTDLINAGAHWVDQEVVRDGNLVTSRKPDDLPAFNREMINLFAERN